MLKYLYFVLILAIIGIADASYLTYEHYAEKIPPCSTNVLFADCGKVLTSQYATVFTIPVALFGVLFYGSILALVLLTLKVRHCDFFNKLHVLSAGGLLASSYFVYLQLFVIKAVCFYCMISALDTLIIFILLNKLYRQSLTYCSLSYEK